jgi:purine-binding chemotaxis protein CheW
MSDNTPNRIREVITFIAAGRHFCIDVMSVREIKGWAPTTPVAHAPPELRGILNLRGMILPIVDFAVRLGLRETSDNARHAILVVDVGGRTIGLLVEAVSELLSISNEQMQPPPEVAQTGGMIEAMILLEDRIIAMVKPSGLQTAWIEQSAA